MASKREKKALLVDPTLIREVSLFHGMAQMCLKVAQEAHTRRSWKDSLINVIDGAATSFYKCRINDKAKLYSGWRKHWEKEWHGLQLYGVLPRLLRQVTTFKNKKKAAEEAFQEYIDARTTFSAATEAANIMEKDYGVRKAKKVLSEEDIEAFYDEVEKALEIAISKAETESPVIIRPGPDPVDLSNPRPVMNVINIEEGTDWAGKKRKKKKKK